MAGMSLETAEAHLAAWLNADMRVAEGQSWSIAGRSLTRADAEQITAKIAYWQGKVTALKNGRTGGARVRYGVVGSR